MSRSRFILLTAAWVAAASLLGLASTVPIYQCWLFESRLPLIGGQWLFDSDYCHQAGGGEWQLWLPLAMVPLASILPTVPALMRLQTLGRSRWWGLAGLLPGVNLLLYAYLALAPWPLPISRPLKAYLLPAGLCLVAAWLYYHLMLYLPWLAFKV